MNSRDRNSRIEELTKSLHQLQIRMTYYSTLALVDFYRP